jgi:hypothetical protein
VDLLEGGMVPSETESGIVRIPSSVRIGFTSFKRFFSKKFDSIGSRLIGRYEEISRFGLPGLLTTSISDVYHGLEKFCANFTLLLCMVHIHVFLGRHFGTQCLLLLPTSFSSQLIPNLMSELIY